MFVDYILAYIVSLVLCRLFWYKTELLSKRYLSMAIINFIFFYFFILTILFLLENDNKEYKKIAINNIKKYLSWLII